MKTGESNNKTEEKIDKICFGYTIHTTYDLNETELVRNALSNYIFEFFDRQPRLKYRKRKQISFG